MDRRDKAQGYFKQGFNCAQSVVMAFCDLTGLSESESARLASSFGGGLGLLREVCGAVSGMAIVAGILYGYDDPKVIGASAVHYALVQELANAFRARNGSIICRELLGGAAATTPTPEARTAEYYKKRPCAELGGDAAEILEEYIARQ
ncbi:MAG: C_GCAxxG_C_C family protein [Clostridia bacterium]|nr:C_GCAxxG_C_C family protein [Clostridia bacterium]